MQRYEAVMTLTLECVAPDEDEAFRIFQRAELSLPARKLPEGAKVIYTVLSEDLDCMEEVA